MKASFRALSALRRQFCRQQHSLGALHDAPSPCRRRRQRSKSLWTVPTGRSTSHLCGLRHMNGTVRGLGTCSLPWNELLPYRNIRVDLTAALKSGWALKGAEADFSAMLRSDVAHWKLEGRSAVWLHIPISLSYLIPLAAEQGFVLHHGKGEEVVMTLWLLEDRPNKLPPYSTHQVGVCGVVFREDTEEVLVTQDRFKLSKWKFPGGLSDMEEDIAVAVVREVKEETGVDTEFRSVLAFRQQHRMTKFNVSDLYFVCRLHPLTYELNPCEDEVLKCRWMHINELAVSEEVTHFTHRLLRLLQEGRPREYANVDIGVEEWPSIGGKSTYKLFLRTRHE